MGNIAEKLLRLLPNYMKSQWLLEEYGRYDDNGKPANRLTRYAEAHRAKAGVEIEALAQSLLPSTSTLHLYFD